MLIGAVDIGGTKIATGVVDHTGRILSRVEVPTFPIDVTCDGLSRAIDALREAVGAACSEAACSEAAYSGAAGVTGGLDGIGIGCTGPVDPFSGVIGNVEPLPGWGDVNLVQEFGRAFGTGVAVENDADAAALAEYRWGTGRDRARFLYVTVSTGIGGGLVLDGRLYRGVAQSHPEIGHHIVDPSGPACSCGAHGCWESLASGPAMARWARANAPEGYQTNLDALDARAVCELAQRGDALALRAVEREGYYLGLGLANLVTLFTPEVIALGGGVMQSAHLFLGRIREIVRQSCGLVPHEKVTITPAALGPDAGLLGAACVWLSRDGGRTTDGSTDSP